MWLKKVFFLLIILLFISACEQSKENIVGDISYNKECTFSTSSVKIGNKTTLSLYSGTRFADENCTLIENAVSLKNTPIKCQVVIDDSYRVDCVDYNLTSVTLSNFRFKKSGNVPVKVFDNENKEITAKGFNINSNLVTGSTVLKIPITFGESVHIGAQSTTIKLNDSDTENMDDGVAYQDNSSLEFGADNEFGCKAAVSSASEANFMVKFVMTQIPVGSTIDNSVLALYLTDSQMGFGESQNMTISYVFSNFSWTEGTGNDGVPNTCNVPEYCWNNKPATGNIYSITSQEKNFTSNSQEALWTIVDVTSLVQQSFALGDKNITLLATCSDGVGLEATRILDRLLFNTKEATANLYPYLNITYTELSSNISTQWFSPIANANHTQYSNVNYQINVSCTSVDCHVNCTLDPDTWCLQETVSQSTVCGGVNTGNYYIDSLWSTGFGAEPEYLNDTNYATYGFSQDDQIATMELNYTKPTGALNTSVWQIKDGWAETAENINFTNLTIPSSCWIYNANKLEFKVTSMYLTGGDGEVAWFCKNSDGWFVMSNHTDVAIYSDVYEEAMWWRLAATKTGAISTVAGTTPFWTSSSNPQNYTITAGSNMLINWTVNATGYIGNVFEFYGLCNIVGTESINANTTKINITIDGGTTPPPPESGEDVIISNTFLRLIMEDDEE